MSKVINLFDPPNTDIPNSLRALADWLEANPQQVSKVIIITLDNDPNYYPNVYAYGTVEGKAEIVYNLELAKASLLNYQEQMHG